jgi:hypothetical protein
VATLNHPPYSPDVSHPYYFLFPKGEVAAEGCKI